MSLNTGESYTLDRFEGEFAILIDNDSFSHDIRREEIPQSAKEGDILLFDGGGFTVDYGLTAAKKESIRSRFDRLKKKK